MDLLRFGPINEINPFNYHIFPSDLYHTVEYKDWDGFWHILSPTNHVRSLMDKKFIFIPICRNEHWIMTVLVNCRCVMGYNNQLSFILVLDSLSNGTKNRKELHHNLLLFLNSASEDVNKTEPFTEENVPLYEPKMPQQQNSIDCGLFMCQFLKHMMNLLDYDFTPVDISSNFENVLNFTVDQDEVTEFRWELILLIHSLGDAYKRMVTPSLKTPK